MLNQTLAKFRQVPRKVCRTMWDAMPTSVAQTPLMNRTGRFIYRRFTRDTLKVQTHFTQFMRNPPLLNALKQIMARDSSSTALGVASIGCSTGAELYSVLYTLRSAMPGRTIIGVGSDLSPEVVRIAERGLYVPGVPAAEGALFAAGRPEIEEDEISALNGIVQQQADGTCRVRDFLRHDTSWFAADAIKDDILTSIGPQDLVLANNFMGPMDDRSAERCLHNMMRLVKAGGYLVVDGVDLDLKTRVLRGAPFTPILTNLREIWGCDGSKQGWPWLRWGAEPIDTSEPDWRVRYTIIFQRLR
ncbi:chemotaxis methyl-accepting protein methylase [Rhizobium sullae]|uniref:Chemotaxis methyl-accepting protein methylase n=2 Tax=Rhizobium sullae TaxID=50338 RepID=A0A4R3PRH4_RHISU|nr:chemotaxis methyl-accepting protein methylase [Rhizobium sullae]